MHLVSYFFPLEQVDSWLGCPFLPSQPVVGSPSFIPLYHLAPTLLFLHEPVITILPSWPCSLGCLNQDHAQISSRWWAILGSLPLLTMPGSAADFISQWLMFTGALGCGGNPCLAVLPILGLADSCRVFSGPAFAPWISKPLGGCSGRPCPSQESFSRSGGISKGESGNTPVPGQKGKGNSFCKSGVMKPTIFAKKNQKSNIPC